ncbi:MAG: signal peptidase II [Nocardioidaceae bacterium]
MSRRPLVLFAAVALGCYLLDLATKALAVAKLGEDPVQVIGSLLQLHLVRNPGAAFSTGTSYTIVLSCIAIVAVCTVLWYSRRLRSPMWAIGLGALLGGVLGNLTDRVFREPGFLRGHVVDFFQVPHWPVFNVADICINVAAAVIILQAVRGVGIDGRRHRAAGDPGADSNAEA